VTNALQLVELLLLKSPSVFRSSLRKEGVLHEVSTISKIELKIKAKPVPPPTDTPSGDNADNANPSDEGSLPPPPVPVVVVPRKSSSVPSDPQDAYVLRARFIKVKYLSGSSDAGGDAVFESLKSMIKALGDTEATSEQLSETLKEIAKLFGSSGATISSFELLKSGLVDGLLAFATETGRTGLWNNFSCIDPIFDEFFCNSRRGEAKGSIFGCIFREVRICHASLSNTARCSGQEASRESDQNGVV
jgi:E3 ubiquitin-protein ligase TRIP12